jgi:hypothetical protein
MCSPPFAAPHGIGVQRYARRRACRPRWAVRSRDATSLAGWTSSSVERQKRRAPDTRRMVTGDPRSTATRRSRFFMVFWLVPSGIIMRTA